MIRATYISIQNFKIFGRTIKIELTNPTVLIGPNNAGKTSVLQAFALWSLGLKTWNAAKGKSKRRKRYGVPINRLNLYQLPVQNARFLWNNSEVRKGSTELIPVTISVGLQMEDNRIYDCSIIFTQQSSEMIYCKPTGVLIENNDVLDKATQLQVNLLYSMSGIAIEEVRHQPERVNFLMGQGMTSEVLRNLCFNISQENPENWEEIKKWMNKLFYMHIQPPQFNVAKGVLDLSYKHQDNKKSLDIASAGRGALQILLLLSYMYSHKSSVILVDEPDAHLEIIKQKTIYALLNDVAAQNDIQMVIATHSEVVLNEAVENSITMILAGEAKMISDKDKEVCPVLKEFGVEHYYKASITHNILYVEGTTDISILKAFAKLLKRDKALDILTSELNCYYIQNPSATNDIVNLVDRKEGYYNAVFVRHFSAIKKVIPDFIGVGIFDSDAKDLKPGNYPDGLTVYKWNMYEIENYFISQYTIDQYFKTYLGGTNNIYYQIYTQAKQKAITDFLFEKNEEKYKTFSELTQQQQELIWTPQTRNKKMSCFLDILMDYYVQDAGLPYPMRKGEYYKLISYMNPNDVDKEIGHVLDIIEENLSVAPIQAE